MTHDHFNRARWAAVAVYTAALLLAGSAVAQTSAWNPGIPNGSFKDEKPPNRLRDPKCKDCKEAMAKLQAALDDWYAMELTEGQADKKEAIGIQDKDEHAAKNAAGNGKIADAKAGLGQPKDAGKEAQKKQQENSEKDAKDKANKGKSAKDVLKEKIKNLLKGLEDCEKNCPPPAEQPVESVTPTPKPVDETVPQTAVKPPPNDCDAPIPKLPPCFDNEEARQAYRTALETLQRMFIACKKNYAEEGGGVPAGDPQYKAWQAYKAKVDKGLADINAQNFPGDDGKDAIDKVKVPCPKCGGVPPPKKKGKTATGLHGRAPKEIREEFCALIDEDKINVDFIGTGETCGHVADCKISNLTDEPISCVIPPMVLESRSGKNQNYGCPESKKVDVGPKASKNVPINGVCLARNKPPANKDSGDDLKINRCDEDSRVPGDDADRFLSIATSIFQAADELLRSGDLKDIPYKDPEKKKDIVVQWATWADPCISELSGTHPATKDDLKKVVHKQLEEQGSVTPEKMKKIDEGIDTIWDKIELTTKKAKDLEEPEPETTPGGSTINISNDTPTPAPETKERPKKDKKDKKDKKKKNEYLQGFDWWKEFRKHWPKPFVDWVEKKLIADYADQWKQFAVDSYNQELRKYRELNKHYRDVKEARDAAKEKAEAPEATQADKDAFDKADRELKKLGDDLKQDFNKTDDGKRTSDNVHKSEDLANEAHNAEKAAGKDLDPATKEAAENYFKDNPPPPEMLHPDNPVQALW